MFWIFTIGVLWGIFVKNQKAMQWILYQNKKEIMRFSTRNEAVEFAWSLIGFTEGTNLADFDLQQFIIRHKNNPWIV